MSKFINEEALHAHFRTVLQHELQTALIPVMDEAVNRAREVIRKKLAEMLIGQLETGYSVERDGRFVLIRVGALLPEEKP